MFIEKADGNYSTYSPDLPGCVATSSTREETEQNMYEAIVIYVKGLIEDDVPVPVPQAVSEYLVIGWQVTA